MGFPAKALESFRFHLIHEMQFAALVTEQFCLSIGLNIKPDGVKIRKSYAPCRGFPVVRIFFQQHVLAALVLLEHEGTEYGTFRRHGACRLNGQIIEEELEACDGLSEEYRNSVRAIRLGADISSGNPKRVGCTGLEPRSHHSPNRRNHVRGTERHSVREPYMRTQHEVNATRLIEDLPGGSQFGLKLLCPAVKADQYASGEITNRL